MNRIGLVSDYRREIAEHIEQHRHKLGRGDAKDYTDYLAMVAEIKAYGNALKLFEQVLERYTKEEELESYDAP